MFSSVLAGPERSEAFFKKWNETAIASVPSERLLVFEVKQGKGQLINYKTKIWSKIPPPLCYAKMALSLNFVLVS